MSTITTTPTSASASSSSSQTARPKRGSVHSPVSPSLAVVALDDQGHPGARSQLGVKRVITPWPSGADVDVSVDDSVDAGETTSSTTGGKRKRLGPKPPASKTETKSKTKSKSKSEAKDKTKTKTKTKATRTSMDKTAGAALAKPRGRRKGWGPFQSVLKERSADFNLTLDVQHLQQEIQQMTTLRDILRSKLAHRRDTPSGSLMKVVREYFYLFRRGLRVEHHAATAQRRAITEHTQREFLVNVFDPEIEYDDGSRGVAIMVEQLRRYSQFLRYISLEMKAFEITVTEDTVLIHAMGTFHFQVLRATVMALFPHVLGNECVIARLVGAEASPAFSMSFYFNRESKISRFETGLDLVATFIEILGDPRDVAILLGKAYINEGCRLLSPELEDSGQARARYVSRDEPEQETASGEDVGLEEGKPEGCMDDSHGCRPAVTSVPVAVAPVEPVVPVVSEEDYYISVVNQYFRAFARGWDNKQRTAQPLALHSFCEHYVSPSVVYGAHVGRDVIEAKWRSITACFDAVRLAQIGASHYMTDALRTTVRVAAIYELTINERTVAAVFPHVVEFDWLMDLLVSARIQCTTHLDMHWEDGSELVSRIVEHMDFASALQPVLTDPRVHEFVFARALLTKEGVILPA